VSLRGVGIDIVEIARVREAVERFGARFRQRIFTPGEAAYCASRNSEEAASLAVRWAAKEAFAKAAQLSPAPSWTDVAVETDGGPPSLVLSATLATRLGPHRLLVSLAHGKSEAVAVVLLLDP